MSEPFRDDRGVIEDLITEQVDAVTYILTVKGAVRGNHRHEFTKQWTFVLRGALWVANGKETTVAGPGDLFVNMPGEPHAWKAIEDSECLVFTRGPRSGENYEADTVRLEQPLLS